LPTPPVSIFQPSALQELLHSDNLLLELYTRKLIEKNVQRGDRSDLDHPVCFLVSAADIPDRTQSLLGAAEK
jgi:hypothetical protein